MHWRKRKRLRRLTKKHGFTHYCEYKRFVHTHGMPGFSVRMLGKTSHRKPGLSPTNNVMLSFYLLTHSYDYMYLMTYPRKGKRK